MKHLLSKITSTLIFLSFTFFPLVTLAIDFNIGTNTNTGSGFNSTPGNVSPGTFTQNNIVTNPSSVSFTENTGQSLGGQRYRPITPQFQQIFGNTGGSFEGMLQRIFEITVYFTVILSVIMMIIGGVEYMGSESVFKKSDGKGRIFAALAGLLIALVSILIISTILPGGSGNMFRITIFN